MKKLVLGSLLLAALASQTTGCIITSDNGEDFARMDAVWSIHSVNPTGSLSPGFLACPTGFKTAALHNQQFDPATDRLIGPEVVDVFDCDRFADFTDELEPGVYDTFLRITSDGGGSVYAESLVETLDLTIQDKTFETEFIDNGGYFELGWDLIREGTNAPLTCRDLPAGYKIKLTATGTSGELIPDDFDCELGETTSTFTAGVPKSTYTVSIQVLNNASPPQQLGQTVSIPNKIMDDRNRVTNLGVVMLRIP